MTKPKISFEFFPPKTDEAAKKMDSVISELAALNPQFMTVTYGAGGSTQGKTLETAIKIQETTDIPTAAHITYINHTKEELYDMADHLWNSGIRHLVALRGDLPKDLEWPLDLDKNYFQYTSHFVVALTARHKFEISVSAYPEKHPDSQSFDIDIQALQKKCAAGSDRAITQFFFDNDIYYGFLDRLKGMNIRMPVVPGILPINDYSKMKRFAETCQASVPAWLDQRFQDVDIESDEARNIAVEILATQLADLAKNNVPHIHVYTLNRSDIIVEAFEKAGFC